jgi:hypothetical protein
MPTVTTSSTQTSTFTLSPTAMSLVRSGFFGKDFDTYRSEIIDFITARFGTEISSNIVESEQGVMLIEMVSFALATAAWYGDRQADETTLRDVRLRENAVVIARQLGYVPFSSIPPVVSITMTITNPIPLPVPLVIAEGTSLVGPGGTSWEMAQTVTYNAGGTLSQTFPVRQGTSLQETFTSNGMPDQVFEISTIPSGMSIAQDTVSVTVNAIDWTTVPLLTYDQINQVEIGYGFNPPRVNFGDGVAGNIPPSGAQIVVNYFATLGTGGAAASNTVTSFTEPLVAGTSQVTATLVHNAPSTPGSDPESIEQIQASAPAIFQTAQRAVTLADLNGWINSYVDPIYGAVAIGMANTPRAVTADAQALTIINQVQSLGSALVALNPAYQGAAQGVITTLTNYWNKVLSSNCKVNIVIAQILSSDATGRYVPAPAGLAQSLEAFLDGIVVATVKTQAVDGSVNLFSVNLTVSVNPLPTYTSQLALTTIQNTIVTALQNILIGRSYGESLRIGLLYETVEQVQGVDYANITVQVLDNTGNDVTSTMVDSFGNVIVQTPQVLTLGLSPVVAFL